jgi:outer membrane murein-binding lipoprotein Lpp
MVGALMVGALMVSHCKERARSDSHASGEPEGLMVAGCFTNHAPTNHAPTNHAPTNHAPINHAPPNYLRFS